MYWFSEGELIGEVCKCYRMEVQWFWYRDVLRQAEQRGIIRIVGHDEKTPFWWRRFDQSIEIVSEKLAEVLRQETSWKGMKV